MTARTIHPNRLREPFASLVDQVNERDRAFFEEHPNEANYLRPFIPGELPGLIGMHMQSCWVLVRRVGPVVGGGEL